MPLSMKIKMVWSAHYLL